MKYIVRYLSLSMLFLMFACETSTDQAYREPIKKGRFEPSWESLSGYEVPEWFRDAKFGIWAHWGPQCQPEAGDWYGRHMYIQGHWQYQKHLDKYGHPSEFGFKDVINEWKADQWNPDSLVALYKKAGARYFFAMGNHHDNLDLWDSKYHEWNSLRVGPKKNILDGWAQAARNNQLPFGVSIHAAHAWRWYESAQMADSTGDFAGVSYDGKLTKADGKGKWWEGLDPQELYAQNHQLSEKSWERSSIHQQWGWENGATPPSESYTLSFYNRTMDMINQYQPDLIYFDDTTLPLWPMSNVGLDIAAHYYNQNMAKNGGELNAVLFGKILTEDQKNCLVWDVERGAPDQIQPKAWQTCTCIGGWHYDRDLYNRGGYKSAKAVIQQLADIVSKNGNLLLNIPVRGDGSIDEKELDIVNQIGEWMSANGECIYDTRPWHIYGEGPMVENTNPIKAQGFNEGNGTYTSKDIRFTTKGKILYAIVMDMSEGEKEIEIQSLFTQSKYFEDHYDQIEVLGADVDAFEFDETGLKIHLNQKSRINTPLVVKIF